MPHLEVKMSPADDVYKDIIRIPRNFRKNRFSEQIKTGQVCKIYAIKESGAKKSVYAILRGGVPDPEEPSIFMDDSLRDQLDVEVGKKYEFIFDTMPRWKWLHWAWNATDPGYQVSSRIALVAVFISVVALAISLIPLF
jgi:hypothetical protein